MTKLTLGSLARKLQKLTLPKIQQTTQEIILTDNQIIERKRDELKAGRRPDGSVIGEYRSEGYRLFKMELNPFAGGKVDLILTGKTKNNLEVIAYGNGTFGFRSTDEKWGKLMEKYNDGSAPAEDLTTISPEVFNKLQEFVYHPELIHEMKQIAGL